jgi:ribosomal protein S18 acetylase RimI-like enzyme
VQKTKPFIRLLEKADLPEIAEAFQQLGWNRPISQYERYFMEQEINLRNVYVAFVEGKFAGYLSGLWTSTYPPFREAQIPEIVEFNILPKFRRQGIGTQLMDKVESEIAKRSPIAGIGVGMYPDYGAAQRMYILRGYVPDGRGLYHLNHYPIYGEQITVNDDLALYFTKELK